MKIQIDKRSEKQSYKPLYKQQPAEFYAIIQVVCIVQYGNYKAATRQLRATRGDRALEVWLVQPRN